MKTKFKATFEITVEHNRDTGIDTNSVLALVQHMQKAGERFNGMICEVGDDGEEMLLARSCADVKLVKYRSNADGDLTDTIEE